MSVTAQTAFINRLQACRPIVWAQIPDLGLYMDQVITYLDRQYAALYEKGERICTPAMVNNYVKCGLVSRPVGKKYGREQLAQLLMICVLKQSADVEGMKRLLTPRAGEAFETLYTHFCEQQNAAFDALCTALPLPSALTCAVWGAAYQFLCGAVLAAKPEKEVPGLTLPAKLDPYHIRGLTLRRLTAADQAQMMALQAAAIAALPDPAWFFPSEAWEFEEWLRNREAFGYFEGDKLIAYAAMAVWHTRGDRCYARKLGEPEERTFDFHDIVVSPECRGRGIHTRFLKLFEEIARAMGGTAIYATVDPSNEPSWHNFEKAGYRCVVTRPAYDGRLRRYYKCTL